MTRKYLPALFTLALLMIAGAAGAQAPRDGRRWSAVRTADPESLATVAAAAREAARAETPGSGAAPRGHHSPKLVGSWLVTVSSPDFPSFQALQSYHDDHTYTDTTDLLATLVEGPGLGAWRGRGPVYFVTFQLFTWNPDATPAGIIQVRNAVTVDGPNHLTGVSAVDFIAPDGSVIPDIGTATFEGTRIKAVKLVP